MTETGALPLVFDGHNDVLLDLLERETGFFERGEKGHIDLPRAREGRLGGGFFAVYVPAPGEEEPDMDRKPKPVTYERALPITIDAMARLFRMEEDSDGAVRVIRSAAEIEECFESGVFAALLHIEGAEAIDPELASLEVFYRAGLRSIGPVWSRPNVFAEGVPFGFPSSPDTGPGLTERGEALVRECNRLGIMIDLSHLNEKGFWDVQRLSQAPLVATHSNAHAITPSARNLTDRQLDAIRDSGGMVGVNFHVGFTHPEGKREAELPVSMLLDHFDYLIARMGIEHVGFGSDYDGATIPAEIGDAAGLPVLLEGLRQRGYDGEALTKLAHGNWVRVLRETWGR
jgi:membrane dipeptidase